MTHEPRAGVRADDGTARSPTPAEELAQLHLRLQDHQRRSAELEARLAAMAQSTSWRITAPLRLTGRCLRWLRSGRVAGDVRALAAGLRGALRRRGLMGVLARLPHYLHLAPRLLATTSATAAGGASAAVDRQASAGPPPRRHPELLDADALVPLPAVSVSIVIPTLNAGPEFAYLLRKLRTQTHIGPLEIVVVDSGSSDDTVPAAQAAGARVVTIAAAEFSHSHARNLGAEQASGDYLLFMVQDAYPLGDRWLYGLLRWLLDHEDQGVVAVSCTEYCRDDSDLMYECSIATHYDYLGCKSVDRIGELRGADHESLRVMGQLSNVACLMPRVRFLHYRFRGAFAEDLDLGVRLIRDGLRTAMLASVKVVHSHDRKALYYLKRSFVSVTFLAEAFDDFALPGGVSVAGTLAGVTHVAQQLDGWIRAVTQTGVGPGGAAAATDRWLNALSRLPVGGPCAPQDLDLGDPKLAALVATWTSDVARLSPLGDHAGSAAFDSAARGFLDDFISRFNHFNRWAAPVHDGADEPVWLAWADAAGKSFALSLGHALAVLCHDRRSRPDDERRWLDAVALQLSSGV